MKAQTLFNKVSKHLLTQMEKSKGPGIDGMCLYRGPNGLRCAIGGAIPNRLYSEGMEEWNVDGLFKRFVNIRDYFGEYNRYLLDELQEVHDCCYPSRWMERLKEVAKNRSLEFKY